MHYLNKLIENTLSFVFNLVPRTLETAFQGIEISKFSRSADPQTPLEEGEYKPLFDTVGYFFQTCWQLQFLLKPQRIYMSLLGKGLKIPYKPNNLFNMHITIHR